MRMRKLGHGHSLVFLATEEVIQLIRDATGRPASDEITAFDVMVWTIRETWRQLQLNLPTWAAQGLSFLRRDRAWRQISPSQITSQEVEDLFCEPESRTLLELYGLNENETVEHVPEDLKQEAITQDILARCEEFGSFVIRDGAIHEEMEVELVHEKEVEREVERPPPADPYQHSIHADVKSFVSTGVMPRDSKAFLPVRRALEATSLDIPAGSDALFRDIMVTEDFYHTIKLRAGPGIGDMDQFLRPVEWLVTSRIRSLVVALSPYEINELLPLLKTSRHIRLHPFHPHSNLSVRSLDGLNFCVIPYKCDPFTPSRDLLLPLNLFSGSLYVRDHKTYKDVCAALRLCFDSLPDHLSTPDIITSSYFVKDASARVELRMTGPGFESNPLAFLRKLLTLRRNGRSLGPSHMGKLLYGVKLFEEDFV